MGLGIGVGFSLLVVIVRTVLPFSPALGAAVAWHFPPEEKFVDEEFDVEDLRVCITVAGFVLIIYTLFSLEGAMKLKFASFCFS